ncbi:MAG TPA: hypothetical protein VFW98_18695 [Gemmatimonadaceae bacterium]|nr:hypothetical protein [Gemmatimonadaceae bacterium]
MLVVLIFVWAAGACLFVYGFAWGVARRRFDVAPIGLIIAGAVIVIISVWAGHATHPQPPSILREVGQSAVVHPAVRV